MSSQTFADAPQSFAVLPQTFAKSPESFAILSESFAESPESFALATQSFAGRVFGLDGAEEFFDGVEKMLLIWKCLIYYGRKFVVNRVACADV